MTEEEMQRQALAMLKRQMREGRKIPRRHQRFALFVVLPLFMLALLIVIIVFEPR